LALLKLAMYHQERGDQVALARSGALPRCYGAHRVLVTSLYTYWATYVREAVRECRELFPSARIIVGGVYASLMPEHCVTYTGCDEVHIGVHEQAERCLPAYDLVGGEVQVLQASRGCPRRCPFCGVWRLEPWFRPKKSVRGEVRRRRLVFYDDNFLANPYVEDILDELAAVRVEGMPVLCESQSGFDGRVLLERPHLGLLLRRARFRYPRIAWDGPLGHAKCVREQLAILGSAGFQPQDTYMFMVYNWQIPFAEMEAKRRVCFEWGVQVADCRFRPLDQTYDRYVAGPPGRVFQTSADYYIHKPVWTDQQIRQFRKNVREHNIAIRMGRPYSRELEKWGRHRARSLSAAR
jgi:hypothetical protein